MPEIKFNINEDEKLRQALLGGIHVQSYLMNASFELQKFLKLMLEDKMLANNGFDSINIENVQTAINVLNDFASFNISAICYTARKIPCEIKENVST